MIPSEARLLRIYVNADERFQGKPLYQAVVEKARALGSAGASVFNVDISYGAHQQLHDVRSEYLFIGIPVIIEIIDGPEEIEHLLGEVKSMVGEGLSVVTPVRVVRYVHAGEPSQEEEK